MSGLISETRVVDAPPEAVFDLLASPRRHREFDGSGSVRDVLPGTPERLGPGDEFGMAMRLGLPYRITNRVVEFEEGRRIAWRHFAGHRWRYLLEPVDGGRTRVTEQFDPTRVRRPWVYRVLGFDRRNAAAITGTLDRLEAWARTR